MNEIIKEKKLDIDMYKSDISAESIFNVIEFTALKCVYNVVASTNLPKSFLPFLPQKYDPTYSNDNLWVRYKAKVDIGFDLSEIKIVINEKGNNENEISIKLPSAKILNKPEIEPDSIEEGDYEYVLSDKDGIIISDIYMDLNDQRKAISFANEKLVTEINENKEILMLAEERVKKIIKAYIDSINLMFNKKYFIKWN